MSAATPAIWWCDRYQRVEDNEGYCHSNRYPTRGESHNEADEGCGPRLLVDPSALVVERPDGFTDAEWESAREYFTDLFSEFLAGGAHREAST